MGPDSHGPADDGLLLGDASGGGGLGDGLGSTLGDGLGGGQAIATMTIDTFTEDPDTPLVPKPVNPNSCT